MPECEINYCQNEAKYKVRYTDPVEDVKYCRECKNRMIQELEAAGIQKL